VTAVVANDPDVFSKGEFARRRGVSPGRVSQWIAAEKIFGPAIVGEGRNAQIRESVAVAQLRAKLDPIQMTANGLSTRLEAPASPTSSGDVLPFTSPAAVGGSGSTPNAPPLDGLEEKIKRARLEQLERQNREGQREEALKAGQLTDTAIARQAAGREAAKLVTIFEGSLSNFANALAAEFKLPQRDVLHLLRGEFRKFRSEAATELRAGAEAMPATVDIDLKGEADGDNEADEA
jgi:hypothetical protein